MNNLPKGFYYNSQGALVNSNIKKSSIEKKVEALEAEINNLKSKLEWLIKNSKP